MGEIVNRGKRAVIAGGGIGGLSAASALAPFFDEVVIYEKDDLPDPPDVRSGANQSGHVHVLLRGGAAGFEELLPGLHDDFERAGAVEIDIGENFHVYDYGCWRTVRPLGLASQLMSRPAYEDVIRNRVRALHNVTINSGTKCGGITIEDGRAKSLTAGGEEIDADLIVDARGRGSPLPRELDTAGYGETPETVIGIVMSYVSGRFKRSIEQADCHRAILVRPEPPDPAYGLVCPVEDGGWIISLGGRGDIEPPMEIDGFFEYAKKLASPDFYEFIKGAELIGPLRRYKKPSANWRHYDQMDRFPANLIPLGDVITSFNPTFGQGMSVSVFHALALRDALKAHAVDDPAFFAAYTGPAMKASESAWHLAGNADMEYPYVTGERPEGFEQIVAFGKGVKLLGNDDIEIQRMGLQVFHMERSSECMRTEEIAGRVMKKLFQAQAAE